MSAIWRVNKTCPVLIGVLLLLDVAAYLAVDRVFAARVEALERSLIAREAEVRQVRQKGDQTSSPAAIYRRGEEDLERFRQVIPDRSDFTGLIEEVFTLADQAGLEIDRISYSPAEVPEKDLLQYALSFTVSGNYGQVKKFIFSLEQSPRLLAIDEITLSGGGEGAEWVGLRVRLSTYFTGGMES